MVQPASLASPPSLPSTIHYIVTRGPSKTSRVPSSKHGPGAGGGLLASSIDYQLTGREWLGFKEAIYYFEKVDKGSCKLTRITTYTSALKPRIYWQPLEKIGISQEHDYVFDNLNNDLNRKYKK